MSRLALLVACVCASGCVTAAVIDRDTRELEGKLVELKNGKEQAVACAPSELALAEAKIAFARYESSRGRSLIAKDHLGEARRLMAAVVDKASGSKCDGDRDGDGIPDSVDKCPDIPEDFDNENDDDGCPDFDKDMDGVPDDRDKCPNDKEDKDGFQDNDGCPEFDNDKDGLLDANDQCPNQAEDFDGYQDLDGCPDADNDGDDIPDAQDKCPNQAGPAQTQGCPDSFRTILVREDQIELRQPLSFQAGSIILDPQVFAVLDEIAQALKQNTALRLRIESHTDSQGDDKKNKKLAADRAALIKKQLVSRGVSAGRLDAVGVGEDKPIDDNDTPEEIGRAHV